MTEGASASLVRLAASLEETSFSPEVKAAIIVAYGTMRPLEFIEEKLGDIAEAIREQGQ